MAFDEINLVAICVADGIGIFLAICILGARIWKNGKNQTEGKLIRLMLYTMIFTSIANSASFICDGKQNTVALIVAYVCNWWIYFANLVIGSLWIKVLVSHIGGTRLTKGRMILVVSLDLIGFVCLVVNFFEPLVFKIDGNNVYSRGPLFWLYIVIEFFYIAYGVLIYFINRRKNKNVRYFPVLQFIIPVAVGIGVQAFVYGISTICPSMIIAIGGIILGLFNESEAEAEALRQHKADVETIREQSIFTNYFLETYVSAYYVNLNDYSCQVYKNSEYLDKKYPIRGNFFKSLNEYIDWEVHAADREAVKRILNPQLLKLAICEKTKLTHIFRDMSGGMEKTYRLQILKGADVNHVAIGFVDITESINEQKTGEQRIIEMLKSSNSRIMALSDEFETLYEVDLTTNSYDILIRGEIYRNQIKKQLLENGDFFKDTQENAMVVVYPDDREKILNILTKENISKTLETKPYFDHLYRLISSGKPVWFRLRVAYKDEKRKNLIIGVFNANEEVLAKQKIEEQKKLLEEERKKAEAANNAKTSFLFNMSHDIRTPMNAILGYTDIALRHENDAQKVHDSLNKIKLSGGHLLNLINDILEMSRIEAGKMQLFESPMDILEEMENIKNMSHALALTKDITFVQNCGRISDRYVLTDKLRFSQVIINLVSNAIKYTNPGGRVECNIRQVKEAENGLADYEIVVKDNGIGMSEEFQKHLFENFSRENSATVSKQEGAGLGLAIVKKILDCENARISVESKKNEGSSFIISLPLKVMDSEAIENFRKENSKETDFSGLSKFVGKKVLVVEDNEMNREIASEILTEAGLNVETAEDGLFAVNIITQKGNDYYDFVLMDIQMPVMNGYEATKEIRKLETEGKRHIPIIAMTANAFEEDRKNAIESGMDEHIAKPIIISDLFKKIEKYV